MKLYTIKHKNKIYTVKAKDSNSAIEAVKNGIHKIVDADYRTMVPSSQEFQKYSLNSDVFSQLASVLQGISSSLKHPITTFSSTQTAKGVKENNPEWFDDDVYTITKDIPNFFKKFEEYIKESNSNLQEVENFCKKLRSFVKQAESVGKELDSQYKKVLSVHNSIK